MVIIQINRVNKYIDDCLSLLNIIQRHFADIIEKCQNLRFRKINLFIVFNGKLFLKLGFFRLPFVESFRQHINRLSLLNAFP